MVEFSVPMKKVNTCGKILGPLLFGLYLWWRKGVIQRDGRAVGSPDLDEDGSHLRATCRGRGTEKGARLCCKLVNKQTAGINVQTLSLSPQDGQVFHVRWVLGSRKRNIWNLARIVYLTGQTDRLELSVSVCPLYWNNTQSTCLFLQLTFLTDRSHRRDLCLDLWRSHYGYSSAEFISPLWIGHYEQLAVTEKCFSLLQCQTY